MLKEGCMFRELEVSNLLQNKFCSCSPFYADEDVRQRNSFCKSSPVSPDNVKSNW